MTVVYPKSPLPLLKRLLSGLEVKKWKRPLCSRFLMKSPGLRLQREHSADPMRMRLAMKRWQRTAALIRPAEGVLVLIPLKGRHCRRTF